ncbi:retinoic acid-induced protein 1 [Trichomycterus rosablanca]|uniref:retinoic acid-induced protein 1 n=1 Tax=Trichomycterus rosablanca TaxID=2290929 RepID=UPI002F34FBED
MQSFRERSGFQGNQHCYQQEPRELSRLENYRHHLGQTGQGYETHSLSAAGMPPAGTASKDCYGQQNYPSYGSGSAQTKKPYGGGKPPTQHVQSGYSGHVSSGYSAQYMSEGHLPQKWDESTQMSQYEQEMVGHLEPRPSGSSQYIEQNMLSISQSQCHLPSQPSAPAYTNPHQQGHRPNPSPSPLMYPQSHVHFPQHARPPSSTSSNYMEKCNSIPHAYKSGFGMPPNVQYSRQMSNHSTLKQSGYRTQNNYGYQQPASRTGFEQQGPMQGIPSTPESHPKFQHYNQSQQNYCITDISVRSPEQYYQNCSPSSSHSPARSVGRSPSYSSTPSPLMPNPDTFQYGQTINPASSSSSAGLQDQNMLMPAHTQSSPSVTHHSQSYSSSLKDRFSEKLFSNPSLWSLNALTSQVENISNNVQQLLLSEALMANKKNGKRNQPKKGEDYRGQLKAMEDSSCPESQHGSLTNDTFDTPRSLSSVVQEGGYSSSTEDQMEQNYYYFGQGKGPTQASAHSQLSLDTVSTCSMNSADDMSVRSGDSDRSLRSTTSEGHLNCDPKMQRVPIVEEQNSSLGSLREERSPISVTATSPMKQESNSRLGIKQPEITQKENLEKSIWTERTTDEKKIGPINLPTEHECKEGVLEETEKQQEWPEDEKFPSLIHKMNKAVTNERYSYETGDTIYQNLESKYDREDQDFPGKGFLDVSSKENENEVAEAKSEVFKLESQLTIEGLTTSPAISRDSLNSNQSSPEKTEDSDVSYLTPQCEFSEEKLSTSEKQDFFEKQQFVLLNSSIEVSENEGLPPTHEVVNNKAKQEESFTEACDKPEDKAGGLLVKTDAGETTVQDIAHRGNERGSAPCDIAPQSHSVKTGFSAFDEKATPQTQARDRIDAKVLEPDSPQLPGKSIMHSAPSWANTPPSPQKGDEEIEPGISCPSAVMPTTKAEPVAPSAHPRLLGRKHTRGRQRLIHSNASIGSQMSVERDVVPPSPQKPDMPSSNSALFSEQMGAVQPDSSQTPKLADVLPSRMCTRSLGSQGSLKVCNQERRKPVAKPISKPDPKVGPKPGQKPGLKQNVKTDLRPGTKSAPKLSFKPGTKSSLRSSPKQGSKSGPKQGPKSGPLLTIKTGLKPGPKSSPKTGLKPNEGVTHKGPGRPRSLNSKTKSLKYKDNIQAHVENMNSTSCISETTTQQENTTATLETVTDTTLCSTIDSTTGSSLDTEIDASFVNSEAKDQKSMVLRSRKQTQGKLSEQKEKRKETLAAEASAIRLTETHTQEVAVAHPCQNQKSSIHENICADSLSLPNEKIISVPVKRKSSLKFKGPINKKKDQKGSQPVQQSLLQDTRGTKGRRKQGHTLEPSICSTMTKESLPFEDDTSSLPPQGPTKTKYLPPRKGRGLKYEAMVQKIASPISKKQPLPIQPDATQDELTLKPALEFLVTEKRKSVNTTITAPEEGENPVKIEETPEAVGIQTPLKKRRKWAIMEITNAADTLETTSLIINTPRLAKQRAIKNNHEMHLKQQKKRKGIKLANSVPPVELHEQTQLDMPVPTSVEATLPPASFAPHATDGSTEPEQLSVELCSRVIEAKRGRRSSNKKKQGEALGQQTVVKRPGIKKKSGLKKMIQQNVNVVMTTVNESEHKTKRRKEIPTVKGKLFSKDVFQPQESGIKRSFKPYVHIDGSRKTASFCTIVNRPEEEHLLTVKKAKRKNLVRIKNEATLTKAIPDSTVMLQGPIVNKSLSDKCLVCCLCGKPANYRELGDLCGPYYPENTIPRKTLSLEYREDFRRNYDEQQDKTTTCTAEQTDILEEKDTKDFPQEESSKADCKPAMKERRSQLRTRLGLHMRFKRLQLLQGRAVKGAPSAGEEDCYSALQRLQLEAEVNEHWAHVSCAVWTSGVILIAGKLYGLKEAAQDSAHTKCFTCQREQASISCSWNNCTYKYHYVCAKETGCIFDEETFSIKCPNHQAI